MKKPSYHHDHAVRVSRRRLILASLVGVFVVSAWLVGQETTTAQLSQEATQAVSSRPTSTFPSQQQQEEQSFLFSRVDTLVSTSSSTSITIPYQCASAAYDEYAQKLHDYTTQQRSQQADPSSWDRRSFLSTGRRILVIGSPYTRQIAYSLIAQQVQRNAAIRKIERLEGRSVNRVEFTNGAVVVEVTNSYVWYSAEWLRYLSNQLRLVEEGDSLNTAFDAIVLGQVGEVSCDGPSKSQVQLRELLQPMSHMDCVNHTIPSMTEWSRVFDGPIVYVSSFTPHNPVDLAAQEKIKALASTRVGYVNARHHVDVVGVECAASDKKGVGTCLDTTTRGPRCVGARGGYADLVAFDVDQHLQRYLWDSLETQQDNPSASSRVPFGQSTPLPRLCRKSHISTPSLTVPIHYTCQGPRYFGFGQVLEDYVNKVKNYAERPAALLPPNHNVLVWGNSHTRQVGRAMACEYGEQLVSAELWPTKFALVQAPPDPALDVIPKGEPEVYRFANNSTLTLLSNSYVPYSTDWQTLLREELHGRTEFDAIVLGHFNRCDGNTSFAADLLALSEHLPNVDCLHTPPPTVTEIAQALDRPVVFAGMFDETRRDEERQIRVGVEAVPNIGFVDTRGIVESISNDTCLSSKRFSVTDCRLDDPVDEDVILHACTGVYGGYADLVAWEAIDQLWNFHRNDGAGGTS